VGGGDLGEDIARVRAVAEAAPAAALRLDGNQGLTPEQAVRLFDQLAPLAGRIELLEQPTPAHDDASLAWVAVRVPVPVFADEAVKTPEDAARLIGSGACAGVVLKLAKSGLSGAAAIARTARAAGGRCLFGCMMETRVAVGAALHLALALGADAVPFLDLDGHLLVDDRAVVSGGFSQAADTLRVDPDAAGLGLRAAPA
jgi:L-alanine-DL-glutamate epimerase-like enolase superfamily enzyme